MITEIAVLPKDTSPPAGIGLETVPTLRGPTSSPRPTNVPSAPSTPTSAKHLPAQLGSDDVHMTVPMAGDQAVSGARLELHPGTHFASLWGGRTVKRRLSTARTPPACHAMRSRTAAVTFQVILGLRVAWYSRVLARSARLRTPSLRKMCWR